MLSPRREGWGTPGKPAVDGLAQDKDKEQEEETNDRSRRRNLKDMEVVGDLKRLPAALLPPPGLAREFSHAPFGTIPGISLAVMVRIAGSHQQANCFI